MAFDDARFPVRGLEQDRSFLRQEVERERRKERKKWGVRHALKVRQFVRKLFAVIIAVSNGGELPKLIDGRDEIMQECFSSNGRFRIIALQSVTA
ncbi:hypothetical protein CEXT_676161 [Caerostris extrusa]|uniref:Uncharacterized protein n=1 Tax=Caerostris extrusa TaxID=172846 RepID=A0AAV4WPE6_CAEEX|nr:hypothetical protein CEXT_676161 [Caerostris extrusa]